VRGFGVQFPRQHLAALAIDDVVSSRVWTNFLSSLDYDHAYFLASDIKKFREAQFHLDDRLMVGDSGFAYEVFEVFKKRVKNRYEYVEKLLENGFDFEKKETYRWKRKNSPWPADEAEWDEIWRKRIKNEYLRHLLVRETEEEEPDEDKKEEADKKKEDTLTPENFIRKRYRQFLTLHEDSDAEWVLQKYLTAFAKAYDPHSDYLSPSAYENFNIEMGLSLVGIGALLTSEDGMARVVSVIPGGPADRDTRETRLREGDKIIAVAQGDEEAVDVVHWPLQRVVELIRGEKGTTVVLTVIPASDPTGRSTKEVDIVRDKVKLEGQAAKWRIEEIPNGDGPPHKLGIITLPAFYANVRDKSRFSPDYRSSSHDVAEIIGKMKEKGVDGMLLDLRNNGGGYLPEAVTMTGLFIRHGPVVQVQQRLGTRIHRDMDFSTAYSGPLVVLLNRLSASASEILAGALQDYGRAVIAGDTKSHGKGTVQAVLPMGDDKELGSLKVTVATYYRVSGASTQLKGISPDIVIPSGFDRMEFGEDHLDNAIPWSRVDAARYSAVAELGPVIPALRRKSEQRRSSNPRFISYMELLDRIDSLNKTVELPLNIEARRLLAKKEKELTNLQRTIFPETNKQDKEKKSPDPVLNEALTVLSDLVTLHDEGAIQPPATKEGTKSLPQALVDWLMDTP